VFEVTQDHIIPDPIIDRVRGESSNGATVSFIGSLRGYSADGRRLRFAECEENQQAAEKLLREVGDEVRARWSLEDMAICHRVGRIEVGDVIMVVAIAAPHRQEAFEACQYAVDRAKENISIKEVF
jgi:molybdopterin synthase catalytic subunit